MIESPQRTELPVKRIYKNLSSNELQKIALSHKEGLELATGVIDVDTRPNTGRSPKDSFVVTGAEGVDYGDINQEISQEVFDNIFSQAENHLEDIDTKFEQERSVGADPRYNIPIMLSSEKATAAQFANIMFLPKIAGKSKSSFGEYRILHAPSLNLAGRKDGVRSEKAILRDFVNRRIAIVGTGYLGEIKKSMFIAMQYELPRHGIATMHCSANMSEDGDVNLFFGLSGTGKTTHSVDTERILIGDDEHGWSDDGIFNFENGSYAKLIGLDEEKEPLIYKANRRKGALSENGTFDLDLNPIYDQGEENMRSASPLSFIENASTEGVGAHPTHIFFLTADASGVLPPIARLTQGQAIHHYLQGYTSKVAGTEVGVTRPEPTFSACFGGVFLPLPPEVYARLLSEKIATHNPTITLINTGWPGGYDNGKKRMEIPDSRRMIQTVRNGEIENWDLDSLGFLVPQAIEGISQEALRAENYWRDQDVYEKRARELAASFAKNIAKFNGRVPNDILSAGPRYQKTA